MRWREPKPTHWFESMDRHFDARRGKPVNPHDRLWTAKEERLLGTKTDRDVAKALKRLVGAVSTRRHLKKIPCVRPAPRPWTRAEFRLLGKVSDREIARRTGHSLRSVKAKRRESGISVRLASRWWRPEEDQLLGTKPDKEIAAWIKRIPPAIKRPPQRKWTRAEDRLLGSASDAAIGRKLERSAVSVQLRRLRLKLPSHRERKLQPRIGSTKKSVLVSPIR